MPLTDDAQTLDTATKLVNALRGAFNTPNAYRPAHAKGHIVRGTFTPTPEAASLSKAAHFTSSSPTPILVRFSDSTGIPCISDTSSNASPRGIAIRFILDETGHQHTDIIAHSTPYFPSKTGEDFLSFLTAIGSNDNTTIATYLVENPAAAAFVEASKPHPTSFATERFFGVNAFKFINSDGKETFIRYRIVPQEEYSTLPESELELKKESFLFEELEARLAIKESVVTLHLTAQIGEAEDVADDATVRWPENRKMVTLGNLALVEYVKQDESLKEQQTLIFDPIPRVDGIEASADPLMNLRAALYLLSGRIRRRADAAVA